MIFQANGISQITPITDDQFSRIRRLIYQQAGISLSDQKKALVEGRLAKRLKHLNMPNYGSYFRLVSSPDQANELEVMVDLLTTNETYFFREQQHFNFLQQNILGKEHVANPFRIWSAACSSGEEVYSLAMLMQEHLAEAPWEILGSDISTTVLLNCQRGVYPAHRTENIPTSYLKKYCLKGVRDNEGMYLVDHSLRQKCRFKKINLIEKIPSIGQFDVIFLRNVMIYFDSETKDRVIDKIFKQLKPRGYLFVSHSESLRCKGETFRMIKPSIYQKTGSHT